MNRQLVCVCLVLGASGARAQISGGADVNLSKLTGYQSECAIAKNPSNKLQLFAACNNLTTGGGLFAARSTDGGGTWTYPDSSDKTIADGDTNQGAMACCDPTLSWDTFGNLYITYVDQADQNIITLLSQDSGQTFTTLATFGPVSGVDQPTVVSGNTSAAGAPVAVWVIWNEGGSMVARGAPVTGLGTIGTFTTKLTIPGTSGCTYGDIAIAPDGTVVQVCQTGNGATVGPSNLLVNIKADGLGTAAWGSAITATATNLATFQSIPPQASRTVDAEAGLAYDVNPSSPHVGRLYLVYTDAPAVSSADTNIMLRWSDTNGSTWSSAIQLNDDPAATPVRSQFFPRIATNRLSGNVAVCWYDCRNSSTNTAMQEYCTMATPTGTTPSFMANGQIGDALSTSSSNANQFGDYSGLAYFQGRLHPIWGDTSNSTGDNPNTTTEFDAYSDTVSGGAAAMEGDPHITTVEGIHWDFQGAGEFVSLRDADGLEIQTRQSPVATSFFPGANAYTGLATCVSLNTAVAARVGKHRISYEPNINGQPDPTGLQLRVDGTLTPLGASPINLGEGGRVLKGPTGDGIEVDFADGTVLYVTPAWWGSQSRWYLNVDVKQSAAIEGIMGAIARGSWLPALANGASVGAKPSATHARWVQLYQTFANSWRVTDKNSLFDYAQGQSTASFNLPGWPKEAGPCDVPQQPTVKPLTLAAAKVACAPVEAKTRNADCVFDVQVTGEAEFAKTYLVTQQIENGATSTTVGDQKNPTQAGEVATFSAVVARMVKRSGGAPSGTVQFTVDGAAAGAPVVLDARGAATFTASNLSAGDHKVSAAYTPTGGSAFLASSSAEEMHTVKAHGGGPAADLSGGGGGGTGCDCKCEIGSSHQGPGSALALGLLLFAAVLARRRLSRGRNR